MYCYRETYMSIYFERIYAQVLDHREKKVKKKRELGRNLTVVYFQNFIIPSSANKTNKCIWKNLSS